MQALASPSSSFLDSATAVFQELLPGNQQLQGNVNTAWYHLTPVNLLLPSSSCVPYSLITHKLHFRLDKIAEKSHFRLHQITAKCQHVLADRIDHK